MPPAKCSATNGSSSVLRSPDKRRRRQTGALYGPGVNSSMFISEYGAKAARQRHSLIVAENGRREWSTTDEIVNAAGVTSAKMQRTHRANFWLTATTTSFSARRRSSLSTSTLHSSFVALDSETTRKGATHVANV